MKANSFEEMPLREKINRENDYWRDRYKDPSNTLDYDIFKRYLRSNLGRAWDDVYSALCRKFTSEVQREGLRDLCKYIHKEWFDFYVDENGILCEEKHYKRSWAGYPKTIRQIGDQKYYQFKGIWYRVETKTVERKYSYRNYPYPLGNRRLFYGRREIFQYWKDVFYGEKCDAHFFFRTYGESVYCVAKQQANKKEVKKLNDLP